MDETNANQEIDYAEGLRTQKYAQAKLRRLKLEEKRKVALDKVLEAVQNLDEYDRNLVLATAHRFLECDKLAEAPDYVQD